MYGGNGACITLNSQWAPGIAPMAIHMPWQRLRARVDSIPASGYTDNNGLVPHFTRRGLYMPLVNSKEMFRKAYEGGYAIGAFNVNNMEIIQGIVEGATAENAPLILQVSAGARKYANHTYLMKLIEAAMETSGLPIVVHLDHGTDFEICKSCIDGGFTSVMIDGSHLPFEENIKLTRQVVEYAHDHGVTVEGELGRLAGVEDEIKVSAEESSYTQPGEVEEFVKRTGVDSLAIAIGTSHGAFKFKGEPKLRFDILEEVGRLLPGFPIVLHGASSVVPEYVDLINQYGGKLDNARGVPEEMLRKAASMAVCKINIDSDLRLAFTAKIREHFALHPDHFDPRQYLSKARAALSDMVRHKIVNVLGCNNKI
jgi:fructose-bisphosphate aldolase class II